MSFFFYIYKVHIHKSNYAIILKNSVAIYRNKTHPIRL